MKIKFALLLAALFALGALAQKMNLHFEVEGVASGAALRCSHERPLLQSRFSSGAA